MSYWNGFKTSKQKKKTKQKYLVHTVNTKCKCCKYFSYLCECWVYIRYVPFTISLLPIQTVEQSGVDNVCSELWNMHSVWNCVVIFCHNNGRRLFGNFFISLSCASVIFVRNNIKINSNQISSIQFDNNGMFKINHPTKICIFEWTNTLSMNIKHLHTERKECFWKDLPNTGYTCSFHLVIESSMNWKWIWIKNHMQCGENVWKPTWNHSTKSLGCWKYV